MIFNTTPLYLPNSTATEDVIINQGGTSSSKTFTLIQILFTTAVSSKKEITVTGESMPALNRGAYRDTENIFNTKEARQYIRFWNKTKKTIYFKNGSFIEFIVNETVESAKHGKRDILFVNEANGISWEIFTQLALRTRERIYIDYNPSAPFWAHEKLIGTTRETNELHLSVKLIISDHRHNTFLSERQHQQIENIKDKNLFDVYARGKTGNLLGLIYKNWKVVKDENFPQDAECVFAIDYGYTNDPTAIVKIAWIGENVFVKELAYTPGIASKQIVQILKANGYTDNHILYSEHDTDMIAALRRLGIKVLPARKGQGSVKNGINMLNQVQVFYTASSANLKIEVSRYMWVVDKITGKPTNQPSEFFNHLMDAIRYGYFTHFYRKDS